MGLNSHTWGRQSTAPHAGLKLCWPLQMSTWVTVGGHTGPYITEGVCFAGKMTPHMGHSGVDGEDISKAVSSGNDRKAGAAWETEDLGDGLHQFRCCRDLPLVLAQQFPPPHSLPRLPCSVHLLALRCSAPEKGAARLWAAVPGRKSSPTTSKTLHGSSQRAGP